MNELIDPTESPVTQKHTLRARMKEIRQTLTAQQRSAQSSRICQRILDLPCCDAAENIVVYAAMEYEVQLHEFITSLTPDVMLFAPYVHSKTSMDLVQVTRKELLQKREDQPAFLAHPARICAPNHQHLTVSPDAVDVIVVPGLAFDVHGNRLGYGGGFYDRLFANLPSTARRIGVCFNEQLVEQIPTQPHDKRMRAVVTAQQTLLFDE